MLGIASNDKTIFPFDVRIACLPRTGGFYGEGQSPEDVVEDCSHCVDGYISTDNPIGIRTTFLVSKKISDQHKEQFSSWKKVYLKIPELPGSIKKNVIDKNNLHSMNIDGENIFSDDHQQIDSALETWITKNDLVKGAKQILGIQK